MRAALIRGCAVCGILLAAAGCGDPPEDPSSGNSKPSPAFSVIGIALEEDPAPAWDASEQQIEDIQRKHFRAAETLARIDAGLLAFQIVGSTGRVDRMAEQFRGLGHAYPYSEILSGEDGASELGLLSRFPILTRRSRTNLTYRIQDREHRIQPGIIDIDILVEPQGLVRVLVARLKDKVFHPSGQTEMRRNEARILARILRHADTSLPNSKVLVAVLLNDTPSSAPIREVTRPGGPRLTVLRPVDGTGDSWTWYDRENDRYERAGYLLVSDALASMAEAQHTRILDEIAFRTLSPHRPLMVGFETRPAGNEVTGD